MLFRFPPARLTFWIRAIMAVVLALVVIYFLVSPYVDLPATDLRVWTILLVLVAVALACSVLSLAARGEGSVIDTASLAGSSSCDPYSCGPLRC